MSKNIIVKVSTVNATFEKKENYQNLSTEFIFKNNSVTDIDGLVASDGYHTFEELYDHRITLFIALCKHLEELSLEYGHDSNVWRSKVNGDGTTWDGLFIMGIGKDKGKQITYHLPLSRWEETDFAETLDQAPEWDGHSSADVLERLKKL